MPGEKPLPPQQRKAIKSAVQAVVKKEGDQTKAAAKLGLSQGHVSAVVNDKKGVGIDTVIRLADELELTTDEVLGRISDDEPEDALADAFKARDWPPWVKRAALSRRNYRGKLSREQWIEWMQGLVTADAVTAQVVGPSAQEEEYERRAAKRRKKR